MFRGDTGGEGQSLPDIGAGSAKAGSLRQTGTSEQQHEAVGCESLPFVLYQPHINKQGHINYFPWLTDLSSTTVKDELK